MTSTVIVRALCSHEWQVFREIRLRALRESPEAFSKTAEEEDAYDAVEWRRRLGSASSSPRVRWLIAEDAGEPVGLACGRVDPEQSEVANVFSMWVEPASRQSGIGRQLLQGIVEWARAVGARQLVLGVAATSRDAMRLYESIGFVPSDERGPAGQRAFLSGRPFLVMTLELAQARGNHN